MILCIYVRIQIHFKIFLKYILGINKKLFAVLRYLIKSICGKRINISNIINLFIIKDGKNVFSKYMWNGIKILWLINITFTFLLVFKIHYEMELETYLLVWWEEIQTETENIMIFCFDLFCYGNIWFCKNWSLGTNRALKVQLVLHVSFYSSFSFQCSVVFSMFVFRFVLLAMVLSVFRLNDFCLLLWYLRIPFGFLYCQYQWTYECCIFTGLQFDNSLWQWFDTNKDCLHMWPLWPQKW